jgi:hypothetical protein
MEFKIGDKVKLIKSSSYYQTQGIDSDGYCMDGEIIYDISEVFAHTGWNNSVWGMDKELNLLTVKWKNGSFNSYEVSDLVLTTQEHRDKQLNIILDGV